MKVAAVLSLPFHRWILADTVAALRALGVEVEEVRHIPTHTHDWATGDILVMETLRHVRPDALLLADYPYGPFRDAAGGAPVFATRHSLAARGNTYDREQRYANWIATWGDADRALLRERSGTDDRWYLDTGCPWAGPLLAPTIHPGGMGVDRPIVAWCPTWNDWSPDIADELAKLQAEGVQVVYRPHYATAWRNPAALDRARALGFTIDDPLEHPANLLLQADVLVGDVSGIVLLALAVPGAALPIVQVDPPDGTTGAQIEGWGPEWKWRDRIGDRVPPDGVREAVRDALDTGFSSTIEAGVNRRILRRVIFGDDPLPGGLTPGQRLAREIVARAG